MYIPARACVCVVVVLEQIIKTAMPGRRSTLIKKRKNLQRFTGLEHNILYIGLLVASVRGKSSVYKLTVAVRALAV